VTFNVFEAPDTNVIFHTNSDKLLLFWNFCDMSDSLSMKKEPSVNGFNVIDFQKKDHTFRGTKNQESVYFPRSFLLPFWDNFSFFTVDFNVKLWWHSLAKSHTCDLLIEISSQTIFYLVLMQQVFENCRVWLINSIDTNTPTFEHNENSIDVATIVQKYNLLCPWWWENGWNYCRVLPIWVLKLHRVIRKKSHYRISYI
jgi:hypothetical protein